ncbi:glycosyltransferase family 4 protein [Kiritimatiellota bacterium B12222]|nr:glycosyltransferase family 4 protein [Kiritimatiellota bacterium B12222]
MKILILSPRLPHAHAYSGMQMVYQRMTRLRDRGHQVGLICYVDEEQDTPYLGEVRSDLLDLEVIRAPWINRVLPDNFTMGKYASPSSFFRYHSGAMKKRVGEIVARRGYDVVIAEFTAMGQCLHQNPYLPGVRKIISCHDSPTLGSRRRMDIMEASLKWGKQWMEYRHMRMLEFELYRDMDRVLTLTDQERFDLLEEDSTLGITTVRPGLSSKMFKPIADLPKEHCIIITARFSSDQSQFGCLWFLRSVWPILRGLDPEVKLYLVGRDPSSGMRRHARRDERIFVTGGVQDLRPFLAKSKIYVCPVLSGSGVRGKILEAMAMNLPVVSTSIGAEGIPVEQGNNAFIADSPEVMAGMLFGLLHDEEKCKSMGEKARHAVETCFAWEESIDRLEQVLQEVVSKRSYHQVA